MLFLLLCRRVAVAGLHCLLPSASNVLPSTFNPSGEVTSMSAARCLLMYCQVPSICLGESLLCLCFSRALILSAKSFVGACCFWTELCVDPAPVQESCSRRAALRAAKCFQCTAEYLQSVWGSHFCVCCQVSPNVLPSTFNMSGGVTCRQVSLNVLPSTFNLSGGVTSVALFQ